jgi:hypothetical protein
MRLRLLARWLPPGAGAANMRAQLQVKDVQNVMGILYAALLFIGQTNMLTVMPVVGYERVVFYRCGCGPGSASCHLHARRAAGRRWAALVTCTRRSAPGAYQLADCAARPCTPLPARRERSASMYAPFANGIALALVELPYIVAQTALFMCISYFMVRAAGGGSGASGAEALGRLAPRVPPPLSPGSVANPA